MKLVERGGLEVTPIAVNGVMYLSAGNKVLALIPQTGKEIWHYELAASQASSRGVAYWPGDGTNAPRIIFTTLDRKLIALDAATGKLVPSFATGGIAELTVGYNGVPTIFKNIALLGASVGELPRGPPGDTRAYDAITGQAGWTFHTVPRPGEIGHETWLDNGWEGRSGTNVWGWYMTARRKDQHDLYAHRRTFAELLRRRPAGREPVRKFRRRRGRQHGQAQMVFPDHPSRPVGFRSAAGTEPARPQGER